MSIASEPRLDAPLLTWRVPECAFPIEWSHTVLEEIRQEAIEAFFSLPHGGAEIGGVLFGTRTTERVRIAAFRPLACEHAFGPSFTLSPKDHARLRQLLDGGSAGLRERGLEPVGWYHSHTRSEIFLSEQDLEIYNHYFPDPMQVAVVLRPHAMKPVRAGLFFREADGSIHAASSYLEFELQPGSAPSPPPPPRPDPPPAPAEVVSAPVEAAPEPEPVAPPSLRETRVPRFLTEAPRRRSWQWLWWTVLLAAVAAGAFASRYLWMPVLTHEPAMSASLTAFDLDGQLQIHWDRATEPVRSAAGGILEITEGVNKTVVALDARRLQSGSFSYSRQTPRVDVRLALDRPNGRFEEFTSFVGQAPAPKPAPSAAPKDDTTAKLRKELRDQAARTRQLERAIRDMREQILSDQENRKR